MWNRNISVRKGDIFTKEGTVFPSESCPRGTNFPREFCPGGHYFQGDNNNCDNGLNFALVGGTACCNPTESAVAL